MRSGEDEVYERVAFPFTMESKVVSAKMETFLPICLREIECCAGLEGLSSLTEAGNLDFGQVFR